MSPLPREGFDSDEIEPWGDDEHRAPRLTYRRANTITPTKPAWRWNRWLPVGCLVLLVGRQGGGKTTFATWVIGQVSTGRSWPVSPATLDEHEGDTMHEHEFMTRLSPSYSSDAA
jgi:hypothetical protein